nr:hypothetical protein [Pseudomonas lactucae]
MVKRLLTPLPLLSLLLIASLTGCTAQPMALPVASHRSQSSQRQFLHCRRKRGSYPRRHGAFRRAQAR